MTILSIIGFLFILSAIAYITAKLGDWYYDYRHAKPDNVVPLDKKHRRTRQEGKKPKCHKRVRLFETKPMRQ
mgnify:CR=1 FL=1